MLQEEARLQGHRRLTEDAASLGPASAAQHGDPAVGGGPPAPQGEALSAEQARAMQAAATDQQQQFAAATSLHALAAAPASAVAPMHAAFLPAGFSGASPMRVGGPPSTGAAMIS